MARDAKKKTEKKQQQKLIHVFKKRNKYSMQTNTTKRLANHA